jgi:hypothetical protein
MDSNMTTITIKDFSCISHAELRISTINIIIGPQGSGKSVTTKMLYFFVDILEDFMRSAEDGVSLSEYKGKVEKLFATWFPPAAWGNGRFNIFYESGLFTVRILRRKLSGKLSDQIIVKFSTWFDTKYEFAKKSFNDSMKTDDINNKMTEHGPNSSVETAWRIRSVIQRAIERDLEGNYFSQQTFIPAGRAFFTSIGRLVAGIEHAGSLDPVTLRFARIFASWRDRASAYYLRSAKEDGNSVLRSQMMSELFGGKISTRRDAEYIEMPDGRKVPFSSLSSGQQELIPIWFYLDSMALYDSFEDRQKRLSQTRRQLVYIEEPEAHLFPSAQSSLMNFLIGSVVGNRPTRSLVITTHSPYIMSKLNVYLKAGQLSRRKKKNSDINDIVPRNCWIRADQISVWKISEGRVVDIFDYEEGLVDASYLDSVSDVMANEFTRLLEIEASI